MFRQATRLRIAIPAVLRGTVRCNCQASIPIFPRPRLAAMRRAGHPMASPSRPRAVAPRALHQARPHSAGGGLDAVWRTGRQHDSVRHCKSMADSPVINQQVRAFACSLHAHEELAGASSTPAIPKAEPLALAVVKSRALLAVRNRTMSCLEHGSPTAATAIAVERQQSTPWIIESAACGDSEVGRLLGWLRFDRSESVGCWLKTVHCHR